MKLAGQIAKEVYGKFRHGDIIGDTELAIAAMYFHDLAEKLSWLGPEFSITWKEANNIAIRLAEFCDARTKK
jgi:hypothetical protein